MDSGKIISRKLTREQIRDEAENFRKAYIFSEDLPVDIERIVEAILSISIIPEKSLQKSCDMDGFITKDLKSIYVDEDLYMDDRYYKRVRFTIAHEIGHYVLHRGAIENQKFEGEEDWVKFRMNIDERELSWFEFQASEFAGRLLVPVDALVEEFVKARQEILRKNTSWNSPRLNDDDLFILTAPMICKRFDVSAEVIERRLRNENIMKHIGR
jgi:Zn-dependent peptidase ImmA (M78 family)